jgi:hypothetical protein
MSWGVFRMTGGSPGAGVAMFTESIIASDIFIAERPVVRGIETQTNIFVTDIPLAPPAELTGTAVEAISAYDSFVKDNGFRIFIETATLPDGFSAVFPSIPTFAKAEDAQATDTAVPPPPELMGTAGDTASVQDAWVKSKNAGEFVETMSAPDSIAGERPTLRTQESAEGMQSLDAAIPPPPVLTGAAASGAAGGDEILLKNNTQNNMDFVASAEDFFEVIIE